LAYILANPYRKDGYIMNCRSAIMDVRRGKAKVRRHFMKDGAPISIIITGKIVGV